MNNKRKQKGLKLLECIALHNLKRLPQGKIKTYSTSLLRSSSLNGGNIKNSRVFAFSAVILVFPVLFRQNWKDTIWAEMIDDIIWFWTVSSKSVFPLFLFVMHRQFIFCCRQLEPAIAQDVFSFPFPTNSHPHILVRIRLYVAFVGSDLPRRKKASNGQFWITPPYRDNQCLNAISAKWFTEFYNLELGKSWSKPT